MPRSRSAFWARHSSDLDLVDLDPDALRIAALSALQFDSGLRKYAFHACDLTGLKDRLERRAEEIVADGPTAATCLGRLAEALVSSPPVFWRPKTANDTI